MEKKQPQGQQFEFKAEMKQLLHLIIHSLYTHPEVFLRELISNASDALNKAKFLKLTGQPVLDPDAEMAIRIQLDAAAQTFSIEDAGIGMTEDELIANIGTIARSGTLDFLEELRQKKEAGQSDLQLIGQFGVGFYSVFMVAEEVSVDTRHALPGSKGCLWRSTGEGSFTIEGSDRKERGTKISFRLKDSAKEFAQEYTIKEIITKYSNFADFPIYVNGERVNKVTPLWTRKASDIGEAELNEFYKFFTNELDTPLGHLQVSLEGAVNFKALVFVPRKAPYDLGRLHAEKSLHLYSNKILIQNDCKEVLPDYLRFVKGVVDTADLPLNVSREVTQYSPVMAKIKEVLTARILGMLAEWAAQDKEKYQSFYGQFGALLKLGINTDFENRDKIIELLRFESSLKAKGEMVSLKEYVAAMAADQKEIYYISGENRDVLERNPNLEYFNKNRIEVLFLTEPVDVFTVPSIHEYEKKHITSVEKADIELKAQEQIEKPDDNLSQSLLTLFKEVLKDRVEGVVSSKRLVDSPATLVTAKDGMDPQMEKMMRLMDKEFSAPTKKVMEINLSHPLVRNLSRLYLADTKNPLLRQCITQLYEGTLLVEQQLPVSADFVKRMNEIMQAATEG